jgi:hypothetical protein
MVLGPWTHGERSVTHAGDVEFGPQAALDGTIAPDYLQMRLSWFDRWLKGTPAAAVEPAVRYFRMGGGSGATDAHGRLEHGGCWRVAADWPLPGTQAQAWYLDGEGGLAPHPPAAPAVREYTFDPADPVPTIGGAVTSGEPLMEAGAFDQRTHADLFGARPPYGPLAERDDVLVFQSAPLQEDMEVTGTILVKLWISSSAPDTDFTAKLIDVHPDGHAMNLTDGILRCRYRRSWEQPELLADGEIAEITIEPMPTSNLFRRGHRIRLDISSSNFPRFDVNPNTGAPEGEAGPRRVARNRVHISDVHPSRVILPVIPQAG